MDKRKVVEHIQSFLAEELSSLLPSVEAAESSGVQIDKKSTQRIQEIQQQLTMYKFLPVRQYGSEDVVCPSALVELELTGRHAYYFIVPSGGGLIMKIDGNPVQVITPLSPLGEALMGKRVGDRVRVATAGAPREYQIVSLR